MTRAEGRQRAMSKWKIKSIDYHCSRTEKEKELMGKQDRYFVFR